LLFPPSRNAIDKTLPPWSNGSFGDGAFGPDDFGCNCVNATRGGGEVPCQVGQSCFWFSNGCSIGCATCDGGAAPHGGANPNTVDRCGSGAKATINDPKLRTFNREAAAGSPADIYQHNPWRAPGTAPVFDSCGMAGGFTHLEAGQAKYTATIHATQGMHGSMLPPAPSGTVWTAGDVVQTAISIRANHGGGYSFRLCPLGHNLTEECFRKIPLPFVPGQQTLRWANGSELLIGGTYTSSGTFPVNSSWAMNPLPYSNGGSGPQFSPPCRERGSTPAPAPRPPPPPTPDRCTAVASGPASGFESCGTGVSYCDTDKVYSYVGNVSLEECVAACQAVNCSCFDYNPTSAGQFPFEHCRVANRTAWAGVVSSGAGYTAFRRSGATPLPGPRPGHSTGQVTDGYCSGEFPFNVMVLDAVQIPTVIAPGDYVLSFRWDCEKSAQVWAACADVTIAP